MSLNKKLIERAKEHNIELSESQALQLESFAKLLIEENQKYNLTALTQQDEIIDKHFIDSLKGLRYINKQYKIVDIGSGAGFPAIPLKIVSGEISAFRLPKQADRLPKHGNSRIRLGGHSNSSQPH